VVRRRAARRRTARRTARRRSAGLRRGMTLVEVVFAVLVLSIGLLALAGLGLASARMTKGGGIQMSATAAAQARFDSLASLPCQTLAVTGTQTGSTQTVRGVRESWAVSSGSNVKVLVDTLWVSGRSKPLVFLSELPCR
jgi:prepilin-type N-terminal cleavage/methylation domain-containing protein